MQTVDEYFKLITSTLLKIDNSQIDEAIQLLRIGFDKKNIFIIGNGGSALNGSHLLLELTKELNDFTSLKIFNLSENTGILTAIANDIGFDVIFSKQLEKVSNKSDILVAITTSGKSINIIKALKMARKKDLKILCFSGNYVDDVKSLCDIIIRVPSENPGIVESCHLAIFHLIRQQLKLLFK